MGEQGSARIGLFQAIGAYMIWGFIPLFFKQLQAIDPFVIVAHRVIWSILLLIVILVIFRRLPIYFEIFKKPELFKAMALTSTLMAANWLIYIWAIQNEHILAASLGYYLNPLLNVVLGFLILKERLNRWKIIAVILAVSGVCALAMGSLDTIWISLALGASFSCYGLIRKVKPIAALPGLASETTILTPIAIIFLIYTYFAGGFNGLGYSTKTDIFLILGGVVTAAPILLFTMAAKKLTYTTIGFIQYIGPSIQLLLAVFLYNEKLTIPYIICFSLIWAAIAVYSINGWIISKSPKTEH